METWKHIFVDYIPSMLKDSDLMRRRSFYVFNFLLIKSWTKALSSISSKKSFNCRYLITYLTRHLAVSVFLTVPRLKPDPDVASWAHEDTLPQRVPPVFLTMVRNDKDILQLASRTPVLSYRHGDLWFIKTSFEKTRVKKHKGKVKSWEGVKWDTLCVHGIFSVSLFY